MSAGCARAVAGVALCALAGCREERHAGAWMPPVLTEADIARYERAADDLSLGSKTLEEQRGFFGVDQREVTAALSRAGFTPAEFLEFGETMYLARHGKRVFVELPKERKALAARLAAQKWSGPHGEEIREALLAEARSEAETSPLIERVIQNAATLEAYEAKKQARSVK